LACYIKFFLWLEDSHVNPNYGPKIVMAQLVPLLFWCNFIDEMGLDETMIGMKGISQTIAYIYQTMNFK